MMSENEIIIACIQKPALNNIEWNNSTNNNNEAKPSQTEMKSFSTLVSMHEWKNPFSIWNFESNTNNYITKIIYI